MKRRKPWGGRFEGDTHPKVETFTASIEFDQRLAPHDIAGSIAHAQMNRSSRSMMMKRIATVENLMANRPSATAIGSLPHSKGSAFTGVSRRGAISVGINRSAPATSAPNANTMRIGA